MLWKTNLAVIYLYFRIKKGINDNKRRLYYRTPSMILFFFKYIKYFYIYMCTKKNVWKVKHQKKVNSVHRPEIGYG